MNQNQEPTANASTSCCDWRKMIDDVNARAQTLVRDEPAKAAGLVVLGGVLVTVLPIGRLLGVIVRLAIALIRPLLLMLGAMKLYEEIDKRNMP